MMIQNSDNTRIPSSISSTNYNSQKSTSPLDEDYSPGAEQTPPERSLWRSVISQALSDATTNSRKADMRYYRQKAIEWLLGSDDDFIMVCNLAELEPEYVRQKALAAIAAAHASSRTLMQQHRMEPTQQGYTLPPVIETKSLSLTPSAYCQLRIKAQSALSA